MRKLIFLLIVLMGLAAFYLVGLAQDQPTPLPESPVVVPNIDDEADGATLETVTADTDSFVGSQVTLEGVVAQFLNARAFVLGEGATVDDDRVLVINNGPQEFDLRVALEERVQITGVVYQSLEMGGFDNIVSNGIAAPSDATSGGVDIVEPTTDPAMQPPADAVESTADPAMQQTPANAVEPTADPAMQQPTPMVGMTDASTALFNVTDLSVMRDLINRHFPNYTIVEVTSVDDVLLIAPEQ